MKTRCVRGVGCVLLSVCLPFWADVWAEPVVFTADTLIGEGDLAYEGADFTVQGCVLTVQGPHAFGACRAELAAVIDSASTNLAVQSLFISASTVNLCGGSSLSVADALTVATNSLLFCRGTNRTEQVEGAWAGQGVTIACGSLAVDSGSRISANGQGYASQATAYQNGIGPGYGEGGGAHAGAGGSYGGRGGGGDYDTYHSLPAYGHWLEPGELGSSGGTHWGGPSGAGGGAIRLSVTGAAAVDGQITANGDNATGHSGGGAGGSVWLAAGALTGAGALKADGGSFQPGYAGGGGGGGRVVVVCPDIGGFLGFAASTASGAAGSWYNGSHGTAAFVDPAASPYDVSVYQRGELTAATPSVGAVRVFANGAFDFASNVTYAVGSLLLSTNVTAQIGGGATVAVAGDCFVATNAVVWCRSVDNSATNASGQWVGAGVTISAGDLTVEAGGLITADGQGYVGWQADGIHGCGPGTAARVDDISPGAGHGGAGGYDRRGRPGGGTYGTCYAPVELGSGAPPDERAWGGSGGGAIRLVVDGELRMDGRVSANGSGSSNAYGCESGAGAGGSVWVTTHTLSGGGAFTANGGTPGSTYWAGAGGGGRIAVYSADDSAFTGFAASTAAGGSGDQSGGAGTAAFFSGTGAPEELELDVYGTFTFCGTSAVCRTVRVGTGGTLVVPAGFALDAGELLVESNATVRLGGGAALDVAGELRIQGGALLLCQSTNNAAQVEGAWVGTGVTIQASNVVVEADGAISADGQGYASVYNLGNAWGYGPGGPSALNGASHGGQGSYGSWWNTLGPPYGSILAPVDLGSSGGSWESRRSGAGGGAIRLQVWDTLTLDGRISANGGAPVEHSGAGAGGSLWVTAGALSGAGRLEARGADYVPGYSGGAGGGGRIAVYFEDWSGYTGLGSCTTAGGTGWSGYIGATGSVVFVDASVPNGHLHVMDRVSLDLPTNAFGTVTVHAGAILSLAGGSTLQADGAITVCSNGVILCQSTNATAQVGGAWAGCGATILAGDLTVESGGQIHADGQGYAGVTGYGVSGNGPGGAPSTSGGSHGGVGGIGSWQWGLGATYGSNLEPVELGSSGGAHHGDLSGAGGGAIRIVLSGTLTLEGRIGANGATPQNHAGAGAGGSLWVTAATLTGAGRFEARGANGNAGYAGGGGGGGRVAVYTQGGGYSGAALSTVAGGSGWNGYQAGPGSMLFVRQSASSEELHAYGVSTYTGAAADFDVVTVHAAGRLTFGPSFTLNAGLLNVDTGAVLTVCGGSSLTVTGALWVANGATLACKGLNTSNSVDGAWAGQGVSLHVADLLVEAGGALSADGGGYAGGAGTGKSGAGPGGGRYGGAAWHAAGGSHGGSGGRSYYGGVLGPVYGSLHYPATAELGSGGSADDELGNTGGAGGGAIDLQVDRSFVNEGTISANGVSGGAGGDAGGGGGAGGGLVIRAPQLSGSGWYKANGGGRAHSYGAGGGGGRIAFYLENLETNLNVECKSGDTYTGGGGGSVLIVYTGTASAAPTNISVAAATPGAVVIRHDSDFDILSDSEETPLWATLPDDNDSDDDGTGDGSEVELGLDPADGNVFPATIMGEVLYGGSQTSLVRVVAQTAGFTNRVLALDGSGDTVTVPHSPSFTNTTAITVEYWIKGESAQPESNYLIVDKSHGFTDVTGWAMQGSGSAGTVAWFFGNGVDWNTSPSLTSSRVLDGTWHHVAGTFDGSALRLYVDGVLQAERAYAGTMALNDRPVEIGSAWGGGSRQRFLRGSLDDVRVWERALTPSEIQATMWAPLAGSEPGLAACWDFDDGTANDGTAALNHGTLVGDATTAEAMIEGVGCHTATIITSGAYALSGVPTPADYTVWCYQDFDGDGAWDVWEPRAEHAGNPLQVTNDVSGVDLTLPLVAPPVADAGGPYAVDEITGVVSQNLWTVQLNGNNSTDAAYGPELLTYEWGLGTETFDGTTLDTSRWLASADGVSQSNRLAITGNGNWNSRYCFSSNLLRRADGIAFEARVKFCRYVMVGLLHAAYYSYYANMPYALHASDGALYVYEDGANRGWVVLIDEAAWYRVRIEPKAGAGARYYLKKEGAYAWTLLYDSNHSSATQFRRGAEVHTGVFLMDDVTDRAFGVAPACRFYGVGERTVNLTVTGPTGLSNTDSTTVTVTDNDPPVALITPSAQTQYESNAVDRVWAFSFSAAASSDDHAIYLYEWDWDYDGVFNPSGETSETPTHTWTNAGVYTVGLRVTDHALQTHVTNAQLTVVTGDAPVAVPGGPYVFDEFTGTASNGAWHVVVDGSASTDAESAISHYLWDFGVDTFDGTTVCAEKWTASPGNVSQSNAVVLASPVSAWGQCYLFSRDTYTRGLGVSFEARVKVSSGTHTMVGFMNTGTSYHYAQMPYALYFANGTLYVYEDGNPRGSFGGYTADQWYQVRIELKASQGARYLIRQEGAPEWTLVYDSNYGAATAFRRGADVHAGTLVLDDLRETAAGANPTYRLYAAGVYETALTVWDQVLNASSATTTVTLVQNAPPVANMGSDKYGSETNCVGGLWTFLFSGAASTDDHGIYRYEWDWDYDAAEGFSPSGDTGINVRHTFSAAQLGVNPVALRVTDHVMQTDVHTVNVILSPGAPPVADIGGPYTVEVGAWLAFDGSGSSDDYQVARYEWDFGDGGVGAGTRPQHQYADLGDYTVTLVVYDNYEQASAAVTTTVQVVAAQAPTADAGGPYQGGAGGPPVYFDASLSHDASGNADGIVKFVWDVNTASDSDSNGTPDDDMDLVGVRPFFTYGTVGIYTAKLTVVTGASLSNSATASVTIVPNLAPQVICVPYHGNTNEYHPTYAGQAVTLKGVVRDAGSLKYSWDFGDGTTTTAASVANTYAIEASHAYTGGEGKPYVARLTVWDSAGLVGSDDYRVMILESNLETRAQIAVDEGLWWLHTNQNKGNGAWSGSTAASTASALQAFEINGHRVDGFGDEDPYVETVDKGFRYLYTTLRANTVGAGYAPPEKATASSTVSLTTLPTSYSLGMESARTGVWPAYTPPSTVTLSPATDGTVKAYLLDVAASNGIAVDVACSYPPYELGMVMDAFAASGTRTFIAATGGANIKGRSFYDLLQDMVDMYAWGQNQPAQGGRGGWRYGWRYGSADNSVSQWGAVGMLAAEDHFGILCPDYVKQENKIWLNASWNGTGFGYDSPSHPWGTTINTTPSALVQLAMDDVATTNNLWVATEDSIAANWATTYGNKASYNYYGRYALTKALRLAVPSQVEVLRNGFNWYADESTGIRRIITDQQYAGGYWSGDYHGGSLGYELSTAWAIVMLTPSLFTQPPEGIITAPAVWGYGIPLTLTAERSFSVDPSKTIAKYMWDFDNDGNFDLITSDPRDPAATYTWTDPHPGVTGDVPVTVTVRLKVVDSADPPQSDETFKSILIAEPPHAPYAQLAAPQQATAGIPVQLDGSQSFDIDPTDFITRYEWDFDNDDQPDLVTNAPTFYIRFLTPGSQPLGLRVVDNGVMSDGNLTSEWAYATLSVAENEPPVADAGGPYTVYEGVPLTLVATNSYDPNGDVLYYAWDFDGDGSADATNAIAMHTWMEPGSNTVWLTVTDTLQSNTVSTSFLVLAVNNPPSFTKGGNPSVAEDSGPYVQAGWATGISAGPPHEAWQTFAFVVTNSLPSIFSVEPSVSTNGTLTFTPAPNANGTATVSLYLLDNGGTDYGGQNSSPTQTFQIVVNPVNDAPVLAPANPVLSALTEDDVNNAGITVLNLAGATISDVDAGALQGIAVFVTDNGNGTWQYSTNAGASWAAMGAVSTNAALLLRSQDRVRFQPNAQNATSASFGYFAWDQTSGSVATKPSAASRGGTTAFSPLSDAASVIVTAVNDAPVLTIPTNRVMNELTLLSVTNTATDVDLTADTLRFQLLTGPDGMNLDTNTGVIAWTPTEAQGPCTNVVTVRVYDNGAPAKAATNSFTVWVTEVNVAPVLTVPTNCMIDELTLLAVTNTAADADLPANTLRFQLLQAPGGMTLDTNTGAVAWTPTEAQGPSTNLITVRVTDSGSPSLAATNSFTVWVSEVNVAPVLTVSPNRTVNELTLLSATNTAADADLPANTLRFALVSAPSGMVIDTNTGAVAWTPTEAQGPGTNLVTVRVYDSGVPSLAATNSFTVWVSEVNVAPVLTVPTNQTISELTLLSVTNTATDADIPANALRFQLLQAPSGMTLDTNTGAVAWTPTEAQGPSTNVVTVRVTDSGSPSLAATNSFTVWVSEVNVAPVLTVSPNRTVNELTLLSATNTAADADIPANTLRFALVSAPSGMVIDTNTGAVAWTPTEAQGPGTNTVTVRVTDSGSPSLAATNSFTVWVSEVNLAPVLTVPTNCMIDELTLLAVTNAATDADLPANTLRFQLLQAPGGMTLDTNNGAVAWTPTEAQGPSTNVVTVRVTDSGSPVKAATNSFTVWVSEVNVAPVLPLQTNLTIKALSTMVVTNVATDADLPANTLTYQLLAAPAGAVISNGVITWPPTVQQGLTTNLITTRVFDSGSPSLAATNTFQVIVLSANTRPILDPIPAVTLVVGETLHFRVPARDNDWPSNTLAYALDTYYLYDPPVNDAALDPQTGQFTWTTEEADAGNVLWFAVTVTDDGTPPLSTTRIFQVTVNGYPPTLAFTVVDGVPQIQWDGVSTRHYQIQYKNNLLDPEWTNLGDPVLAAGGVITLDDENTAGHPSRFYRVVLVPEL